ncbi:MAG: isoprenyl transferase [Deltaproteobacteria bacterium]|nr:isoprenyl transferase [Deltaproteobacteria bacterium]MCL5792661.1 isoprenyl transferase [Deltaproteobacteria bacterium]
MEYKELIKKLNKDNMPRHIAIIMDGNGRWAKKRNLPRIKGHEQGPKVVKRIVDVAGNIGIEVITLYAFSKENWNRPKEEVQGLMRLLERYIIKEGDNIIKMGIKFEVIGDIDSLPQNLKDLINSIRKRSEHNNKLVLIFALSYSGRYEILEAAKAIARDVHNGILNINDVDEAVFSNYLLTKGYPDPDLLIRTSSEKRISNFMLWQIAYTELYITKTLWPDFTKEEFLKAIINFQKRERRFGRTSEQLSYLNNN